MTYSYVLVCLLPHVFTSWVCIWLQNVMATWSWNCCICGTMIYFWECRLHNVYACVNTLWLWYVQCTSHIDFKLLCALSYVLNYLECFCMLYFKTLSFLRMIRNYMEQTDWIAICLSHVLLSSSWNMDLYFHVRKCCRYDM